MPINLQTPRGVYRNGRRPVGYRYVCEVCEREVLVRFGSFQGSTPVPSKGAILCPAEEVAEAGEVELASGSISPESYDRSWWIWHEIAPHLRTEAQARALRVHGPDQCACGCNGIWRTCPKGGSLSEILVAAKASRARLFAELTADADVGDPPPP